MIASSTPMAEKGILVFDKDAKLYCARLQERYPACRYLAESGETVPPDRAAEANVLIAIAPRVAPSLIRAMPRLEWIQALTTGVDNLLALRKSHPNVVLTNVRGIHGPQMSELAIMLMMTSVRDFPRMFLNQTQARWQQWPQPLLFGKTVCIVGLGAIAEALASRAVALGMHLTGVSDSRSALEDFDRVYPRCAINEAVTTADFVVMLAPYSTKTHHLVDESVLNSMKRTAFLINLSRGRCVDEDALEMALRSGKIAGAALDVFAIEPLPPDHSLWTAPRLIITPHIGGISDIYPEQALPIVIKNMGDYLLGGALGLQIPLGLAL